MNVSLYRVAYQTIVIKEVNRFTRIWMQTIVPPAISMALYFVIFGGLIGSRVGTMHGFPYIQYIAPGIIMMSVITNSYGNVVSSFFGSKFQKFVEEMLVAPIPNWVLLAGYVTGGVLRGVAVGVVVTAVARLFTDLHMHHPVLIAVTVVATATLFSVAGFINAIFARKFDDVSIVPTFVLTPLTYLGGVFYSIDLLPTFWQHVSRANPVLYMVNAFRYGMLGVSDVGVWTSLAVIAAFTIALGAWALWLLDRGSGLKP
ncbi:MAG: ABC transporter permease [Gammaproteobacteria bacterium]